MRTTTRFLTFVAALAVAAATMSIFAPSASAQTQFLEPVDADELANLLADATEEQDVCYGWDVSIIDDGSGDDIRSVGSSAGPGIAAVDAGCGTWVAFDVDIHYTSELSASYDSATFDVHSNISGADLRPKLSALTGISEDALLGDADDTAVINATAVLPLLVAEAGHAPFVPAEEAGDVPAEDTVTGSPGSDFLRTKVWVIAFAGFVVLLGLGVCAFGALDPYRY